MRQHGKANISPSKPRALAICDRCGAMYNHDQLRWQYEWAGVKLINERVLVCPSCYDNPQSQLKTIVLPPDPVPIQYPRPENYVVASDPMSYVGFDPSALTRIPTVQALGANMGNMTQGGGVNAAFDSNANKSIAVSAYLAVSNSSYQNTIGKDWSADGTGFTAGSTLKGPTISHSVSEFTVYGPNDGAISYAGAALFFQGSNDKVTWTTLYSTNVAGTTAESITSDSANLTTGSYSYHQLVIEGDGGSSVAVAQLLISVSDGYQNEW